MIYIDRRGNVTRRTVAIRRVAGDVVQAYCFSRKAPRSFKRDNILAIVPANGRRTG
jgi:predicted DNA-binding transcriptional regulator YafY